MTSIKSLRSIFGDAMIDGDDSRSTRYRLDQVGDASYGRTPRAVVYPTETQHVVELMRWATTHQIPVTARGGGSGLAGGAIPAEHGVVCAFERMNRIIEVDTDNYVAVLEPGVVTSRLDEVLQPHGLFFAGYPMSEDICCIGGNVAENAGGGRAVKYGTTANYVLGAEVVTASGEILRLGGKRLKDVTGYNLLQLMIGSEGTLGLFTEITLRLVPRPGARAVAFAAFPDSEAAARCVADLKRFGALSAVEFIDGETARQTNLGLPASQRTPLPDSAEAFLLVELDGVDQVQVATAMASVRTVIAGRSGAVVVEGSDDESVERAWKLRKAVPWWTKRVAGEAHSLEDVVVPPARIPELVQCADELRRRYAVPIAVFGHAGDGNFHITPMKDPEMDLTDWRATIDALLRDLYAAVRSLGGTISGEHGIGRKRTRYLPLVLGAQERAAMRAVKHALDPNGILNPGVALDDSPLDGVG